MQAAPVAAEAAAMIPRVILDMFGLACALCTVQVSKYVGTFVGGEGNVRVVGCRDQRQRRDITGLVQEEPDPEFCGSCLTQFPPLWVKILG